MPVETTVTRCGNCGATLQRTPGVESIRCNYCNQSTWLAPTAHATAAADARPPRPRETASAGDDDLLDRLGRGPLREATGHGERLGTGQAPLTDPSLLERALWPTGAEASSTFGGSWSPSTLLGTPRVYPRSGDIAGAWAPGPAHSPVEWIEVSFTNDVPVTAVRVFETNRAGSTFAVVDTTHGETLLYARPIEDRSGAAVLEVRLDAPRVIRSLRVYVVNRGWTEIDAVCLLTAAPLPLSLRTPMAKPTGAMPLGTMLALSVALVAVLVAGVIFLASRSGSSSNPLPSVSASVAGASFGYRGVAPVASGVQWAAALVDHSSEYSNARNAAGDVLGAPDVFPRGGDIDGAWASKATDGGYEWVTVRFAAPVRAASIVWAETLNPGAVMRVDDLSEPSAPTALWTGTTGTPGAPAALAEVTLPTPRVISAVRLVLDTRRVSGWNEVDAIGLVPAAP